MKRIVYILFIVLCLPGYAGAQQKKITVELNHAPAGQLFEAIESQTDYRIYAYPGDTDSLRVTISSRDEDPVETLRRALKNTPIDVYPYKNAVYLLKRKELMTALPENYYAEEKERLYTLEEADLAGIAILENRRNRKATSENLIYEIGGMSAGRTERVTITGLVTDMKTGDPSIGVTVFVRDPMIGSTTDASGNYSLLLPAGRHELNIQGVGIKSTVRQIQAYSDGNLDIELEEEVYALREVVVSTERLANIRNTTLGMERLKMQDVKNIPMAFGEVDVIKIVLSLPGVKSVGEASSGFNVRGGATDQNLILFNDGTVFNPTHLFGFFSAFNPDVIRDMELYKSSIPAKYGGRISSVLDINSREGSKEKFGGSASIGLLTSRLNLEGPLFGEKTSYLLSGRTTYSDWLLKQLPEKSGYRDGSAGFYDLNATIHHKFNEQNSLYLNGYYSNDNFSFNEEEKYGYANANASIKWRSIFSDKLTGTFTAGYDYYNNHTRNTDNPATAYKLTFGINQVFGKADFSWLPADKHTIGFGFNTLHYHLNPGEYLPAGDESLVKEDLLQKEKALESAVYIGDNWDITPQLSINAGIRYSMFNVMGPRTYNTYDESMLPAMNTITGAITEPGGVFKTYHGPEFRLSARYAFTDDFSVKAGVNTMRQNIHKLSNTTIMSPTDTWKLSDAHIKPQRGMQAAAGLYRNFIANTIETSIEGYYKTMDDYLDYRKGAVLVMNHHIETDVVNSQGKAYGVEAMVRKTQGKLNGSLSYTYSRVFLRQDDPRTPDPVNRGEWYPADFDKPHDFKLVGNYKFTQRFSVSVNCDYSTGRPITLPEAKYQLVGGEFVFYSDRNQYRIPDYFRVDLSINIEPTHHLTVLTHSSFNIGVYNLTGRKNAYSVYYIAEDGKLNGYKMAIFGVPVPYISYNVKF